MAFLLGYRRRLGERGTTTMRGHRPWVREALPIAGLAAPGGRQALGDRDAVRGVAAPPRRRLRPRGRAVLLPSAQARDPGALGPDARDGLAVPRGRHPPPDVPAGPPAPVLSAESAGAGPPGARAAHPSPRPAVSPSPALRNGGRASRTCTRGSSASGGSPRASSGIAFMFSGFMLAHIPHWTMIDTMAWLPAILACLVRADATLRPRWGALGGLALGVAFLAGHPQLFYHVVLATVALGLTLVARRAAAGGALAQARGDPPARARSVALGHRGRSARPILGDGGRVAPGRARLRLEDDGLAPPRLSGPGAPALGPVHRRRLAQPAAPSTTSTPASSP